MIKVIGNAPNSTLYDRGDWGEFISWSTSIPEFELDIETDVSPFWCNKKLITVQIGYGGTAYVLQWSNLTESQRQELKRFLEDGSRCKIIHHAQFEYIVLRFYGIEISNVYDTMVVEKVLCGGMENENYALKDLVSKYLSDVMDKTEQTTFGDDILTESKVLYAAKDVLLLTRIRDLQLPKVASWNLQNLVALENKVVLALGEMTFNGMEINPVKWKENEEWAKPFVQDSLKRLNTWLKTDDKLRPKAKELGFLSDEDKLVWNLNAPAQKKELLNLLFPDLIGATKPILVKYIRENGPTLPINSIMLLQNMLDKDYSLFEQELVAKHRSYLIQHAYLIPAGEITINWNSTEQALALLKAVHPKLKDLSEESVAKTTHPVFEDLSIYKDNLKLINSYGQAFLEKFVEPDGKVRTTYNQIVSTGRLSSKTPNMQNIPSKESIGTRYRNAFICGPHQKYVDSDYVSAELVITAFISNDPVWNEAIRLGQDLHSVCAELVYGKDWIEAAEESCAFYNKENGVAQKHKCSCKKHKTMRTAVKTINFGLCYGMGEMKLASTLKITKQEASNLISKYFNAFPRIKVTLDFLSSFGIQNGYCKTPAPFFRKRWFPFWHLSKWKIAYHLNGVEYDGNLGAIGRQSSNMPIQGCNSDITKQALVYIYEWKRANNLNHKIHLVAQIHDQITTIADDDVAVMWKEQMTELMQEAAKVVIPTGLLLAETNISDVWTK